MSCPASQPSTRPESRTASLSSFSLPLALETFLPLAIRICQTLDKAHEQSRSWLGLTLETITLNPTTKEVVFHHTFSRKDRQQYSDKDLPFAAPEQLRDTGNPLDPRSDLYSLGIIFYKLLTNSLPFHASDLLEWVHCHVAQPPKAPIQLVPGLPLVISDIIVRLLNKNPEDRYQTASGLAIDLQQCLVMLNAGEEITNFGLASDDLTDRLHIPEKLFGRREDIALLKDSLNRVCQRGIAEVILVKGYAGIGKTSLVRQLIRPVIKNQGHFIWGKFQLFKRNRPYETFIDAFDGLISLLLSKREASLRLLKEDLLKALDGNGQILIELLPRMELILGKQPAIPPLPQQETENRLLLVLKRFIGVFCREHHPLVMFLDDLQWVDGASLKLLKELVTDPDTSNVLLIGAYRDNEVDSAHQLRFACETFRNSRTIFQEIELGPMTKADLGQMLSEVLHLEEIPLLPLTELLYHKTGGNPFFVVQFLLTLYEEKLLYLERKTRSWTYRISEIENIGFTDNVVDLMTKKLQRLGEKPQRVLQLAACIGSRFDLQFLALLEDESLEQLKTDLNPTMESGLVQKFGNFNYRFSHDRVQQAAYALIPESRREALHLRIARKLLETIPLDKVEEHLFDIFHQFSRGTALLSNLQERIRVADLGLQTARKAKRSGGYGTGLANLQAAIHLLPEACWQTHYHLFFALHLELTELQYLNNNHLESQKLIDLLLGKAKTDLERANLYNLLIVQQTLAADYQSALVSGWKGLEILGMRPDIHHPVEGLKQYLQKFHQLLGERDVASLANVSEMQDPRMRACMELLANLLVPARYSDNKLFALIAAFSVNLSLEYGPTAKSTVGYTAFAMVLQKALSSPQQGYEFGRLALSISERFDDPAQRCQTCMVLGHYLNHWVHPLDRADALLEEGFRAGLKGGELQWTGYILAYKLYQPFSRGVHIDAIQQEIPSCLAFTEKTRNQIASDTLVALELSLSFLQFDCSSPQLAPLQALSKRETQFISECTERKNFSALGRYQVLRAHRMLLFGQVEEGLLAVAEARKFAGFFSSSITDVELNFCHSLLLADHAAVLSEEQKEQCLYDITHNQEELKGWAELCKENFQHHYLLVEAELARLHVNFPAADLYYEQALQSARKEGFTQIEALAAERAAQYYESRGLNTVAASYLNEAVRLYRAWGTKGKLQQLFRVSPQLLNSQVSPDTGESLVLHQNLDTMAVTRAYQAISSEIVLDELLTTLMRTMLQNGGAQKGCLLLKRNNSLEKAAKAWVQGDDIRVDLLPEKVSGKEVPESILNYVERTGESVQLDGDPAEHMFSSDPYFNNHSPLSLVCMPLRRKGNLIGILLLENSLTRGAFPRSRFTILELLAGQAAISLENAELYTQRSEAEEALKQSEERYRTIFESTGVPHVYVEADKTISFCNQAFLEFSGYSRNEIEGQLRWPQIVAYPEDLERMAGYHDLRRQDPEAAPTNYEFRFLRKDGEIREVVTTVTVIPGTNQSLASLMDITDRKRAVEALHQSERKFRAVFDRSIQFIGLLSTDGKLLDANLTSLEFAGVSRQEVIGRYFWDTPWINHSPSLKKTMQGGVEKAAKGELVIFEATHISKNGTLHYVDFSLKPVLNEKGEVSHIIPEGRDVTERKNAEAEQARLATAIEQSAEAVFITDIDFMIRYANPALLHLSDFSEDDIIGSPMGLLAGPESITADHKLMISTLANGKNWTGRLRFSKRDGSSYHAEVSASPVQDKNGMTINYVVVHRDISREMKLEKEIRQAHKMEAIGTLAGGIAHDFNNILAVIQGHAQLTNLKLEEGSPHKHSLEQILTASTRARELIKQILAFSRKTEQKMVPVQIAPLLKEVLQMLRSSLPTTIDISHSVDVDPEHCTILADSTQIHQVIMNLATNGAYAMRQSGGTMGVHLTRTFLEKPVEGHGFRLAPGNYVKIRVSDTGSGIDESTIDRIFDPYFTTKGQGEGSGMGLAVSMGILKAHRGGIFVTSKPGVGTVFDVLLPESERHQERQTTQYNQLEQGSGRILLVDDEEPVVLLVSQMLEMLGYTVSTTTSSSAALEKIRSNPLAFDLVMTDMTMPELTGLEMAAEIKRIRGDLPIVLCTGFNQQLYEQDGKIPHIQAILMKPLDIHDLSKTLHQILSNSHLET